MADQRGGPIFKLCPSSFQILHSFPESSPNLPKLIPKYPKTFPERAIPNSSPNHSQTSTKSVHIRRSLVGVFWTRREVYLPLTPLRWTPSPTLRPNPRSPVPKPRSPTFFPAKPCKNVAPQARPPSVSLWATLGHLVSGLRCFASGLRGYETGLHTWKTRLRAFGLETSKPSLP